MFWYSQFSKTCGSDLIVIAPNIRNATFYTICTENSCEEPRSNQHKAAEVSKCVQKTTKWLFRNVNADLYVKNEEKKQNLLDCFISSNISQTPWVMFWEHLRVYQSYGYTPVFMPSLEERQPQRRIRSPFDKRQCNSHEKKKAQLPSNKKSFMYQEIIIIWFLLTLKMR